MKDTRNDIDLSMVDLLDKKEETNELEFVKENKDFYNLTNELGLDNEDKIVNFYDRVKNNSIQDKDNSKNQPCHGEHYKNKKIKKEKCASFLKAGLVVAGIVIAAKGMKTVSIVAEYNRYLYEKAKEELSYSDYKEFEAPGALEALSNYNEEYNNLDKSNFDAFGNIKEGEPSEHYDFNPNSILNISEKDDQAIDISTDKVIEEYKRSK